MWGLKMVELWVESIALISTVLYFLRWFFQIRYSRKFGKSFNPTIFWVITIWAGLLFTIYSYLLGSLVLPFTYVFSVLIALYNIKINTVEEKNPLAFDG